MCLLRHQLNRLFKLPPDKTELQSHFLLKRFIPEFFHFELLNFATLLTKNSLRKKTKRGSSKLSAYSMAYSIYFAISLIIREGAIFTEEFSRPHKQNTCLFFYNKRMPLKSNKKSPDFQSELLTNNY